MSRRAWWIVVATVMVAVVLVAASAVWGARSTGSATYEPDVGVVSTPVLVSATASGCGKVTSSVSWSVLIYGHVGTGYLSGHWCWEGVHQDGTTSHLIDATPDQPGKVDWNTWGWTTRIPGWHYDGVVDTVTGHGTKCVPNTTSRRPLEYCWEYAYRRTYHQWSMVIEGSPVSHTFWTALTLRGNGGWAEDHSS